MEVSRLLLLVLLATSALHVSSASLTTDPALSRPSLDASTSIRHSNAVDRDESDPLISFWIENPENGAVNELPLEIRFGIKATEAEEFQEFYRDARLCVELNGLHKMCKRLEDPPIVYRSLPEGNYSATAYITEAAELIYYHETDGVEFTVLSSAEYKLHNARLADRSRVEQQFPTDIDLIQWADQEKQGAIKDNEEGGELVLQRSHVSSTGTTSLMLVIGVKTAVAKNFHRRQEIRDSWASPATLPPDVKVLFLGCDPMLQSSRMITSGDEFWRPLAKERAIYRDLLTEESGCTDGYKNLADKVASFMRLAVAEFPNAKFVMVIDDDVYVKVDELAENLREANGARLYFGEVWAVMFGNKQKPIRDQSSQYYLPDDQYPMSGLLPYVAGPHSVISMGGVRFISRNYWRLRSLNGLDDVSVGLWLWRLQLRPQHTRQFSSVRASTKGSDDLVSFSDLSSLGVRSIRRNLVNGRSFCHGFHSVMWHQNLNSAPSLAEMLQRPTQEEMQSTPLQGDSHCLQHVRPTPA